MEIIYIAAAAIVLWILFGIAGRFYKKHIIRRNAALSPFPQYWNKILNKNVAIYRLLAPELKKLLCERIKVFVADKKFEGCCGLKITDEMRVTIAGEACLLILHAPVAIYPRLETILVYPCAYKSQRSVPFGGEQISEDSILFGESWKQGAVVLTWNTVKREAASLRYPGDITLHEFAHQLDQEDGEADGVPPVGYGSAYRTWVRVMMHEYKEFKKEVQARTRTVIDEYGAESTAEFFASATEAFFKRPQRLRQARPVLYKQLTGFYCIDPAELINSSSGQH